MLDGAEASPHVSNWRQLLSSWDDKQHYACHFGLKLKRGWLVAVRLINVASIAAGPPRRTLPFAATGTPFQPLGPNRVARAPRINMACYLTKGSKGAAHKACAQMCAKKGVPIGVLTDGGDVYLLLDDHNNPDPYDAAKKLAGEHAEISGKKFSKQGVASIVVSGAKGL